jgi:hypothetical protein
VDWINLVQARGCFEYREELSGSIKSWKFRECFSNCWVLKKCSAHGVVGYYIQYCPLNCIPEDVPRPIVAQLDYECHELLG